LCGSKRAFVPSNGEQLFLQQKHDAPGTARDSKLDSKETIETYPSGNVVKHEKTAPEGKTVEVK